MSKWSKFKEVLDYTPVGDIKDAWNFAQDPSFRGAAALLPGDRILTDAVWPVAKEAANQLLDIPYPKEWMGDAQYALSGNDFVSGVAAGLFPAAALTNLVPFGKGDQERIKKVKEDGGSGRDVWESSQGENNALVRGLNDVLIDPTTYLSLGSGAAGKAVVKVGAKTIAKTSTERVALKVAGDIVGTQAKGLGYLMQYPEVIDRVMPVAGKYVKGTDSFAKLKAMDLFQMSASSKARKFRSDITYAYRKWAVGLADNAASVGTREQARLRGIENRPIDEISQLVGPEAPNIGPFIRDGSTPELGVRPNPRIKYAGRGLQSELVGRGSIKSTNTADAIAEKGAFGLDPGPYMSDPAYASLAPTNDEALKLKGEQPSWLDPVDGPSWIDTETVDLLAQAPKNITPSEYVRGVRDDSTWGDIVHNLYGKLQKDRATLASFNIQNDIWSDVMNLKTGKGGKLDWSNVYKKINSALGDRPDWAAKKAGIEVTDKKAMAADIQVWKDKNTEIRKILEDYRKMGLDISDANVTEEHVANRTLSRMINDEFGVTEDRTWFDKMNSIWSGVTLLSPKYWTGNMSSGYLNALIVNGMSGHPTLGETWSHIEGNLKKDPEWFIRKAMEIQPEEAALRSKTLERNRIFGKGLDKTDYVAKIVLDKINLGGNPTSAVSKSLRHGQYRLPEDIAEVGIFDMTKQSGSDTRRFLEKGPLKGMPLGRWAETVIDKNKSIALAIDASHRTSLFVDVKEARLSSMLDDFERKVDGYADKAGIPKVKSYYPDIDEKYSPAHLEEYYKGLGFTPGVAQRISRDMAEAINIADKEATKVVHKAHFSYYRTNLDEKLQKIIPFHYYTSRATRLYAEEMARNPEFLIAYFRAAESLNNIDQEGMSARQKGFLTLFQGINGYTLLANPDAMLGVTKMMGLLDEPDSVDGRPEIARVLETMKKFGYGFFPMIDGGLNMIGAYGDTFEPDMIGIRHRAIAGSIVNALAAEMGIGDGMTNAFYASANAKAREKISGWASAVGPSWLTQKVNANATSSGTIAEANLEVIIQNRIIRQNPDLTNADLAQIMNDPDSPEYQAAWRIAARAGVITQLFNFVSPVSIKIKDSGTDVRSAAVRTVSKFSEQAGVAPYEFNPAGNIEFAAAYKNATGMEWDPKYIDDARLKREIANATPEARPILIQDHLYNQLGTERARDIKFQYNDIAYGGNVPAGFSAAPVGKERDLADRWLSSLSPSDQTQYLEMNQLQDMFVHNNQNIRYAEFLEWRKNLSYLSRVVGNDASYSLYRQKVTEGNPSAKKFFDSKIRYYRSKGMDAATIIENLDRDTRSVEAWLAINGVTTSVRNEAPGATNNSSVPYDPFSDINQTFTGNSSSGGGSGSTGQAQQEPSTSRFFNR